MKKVTVKKKAAKRQFKRVNASASCGNFNIEINARLEPKGLTASDMDDIHRKLRNSLTRIISTLPKSDIYPCEVRTK